MGVFFFNFFNLAYLKELLLLFKTPCTNQLVCFQDVGFCGTEGVLRNASVFPVETQFVPGPLANH